MDATYFSDAGRTARSAPADLPPVDLKALARELAIRGPEAALPQNLTDFCLRALVRDVVAGTGLRERKAANILAMTLAAAQRHDLMTSESSDERVAAGAEPLSTYLRSYQLALISELVDRQVGVMATEYTVENFFKEVMATGRREPTHSLRFRDRAHASNG